MHSLKENIDKFAQERDWEQFHSPKNLSMALSVEVAELMEHFQWLTEEKSRNLSDEEKEEIAKELGDVFIYLIRLSDQLGIDLLKAAEDKLAENARKYPVKDAKGNAKKYTEFE